MWKFIYKDWAIGRLFLAIVLPFYLLYGLVTHMAAGAFFCCIS